MSKEDNVKRFRILYLYIQNIAFLIVGFLYKFKFKGNIRFDDFLLAYLVLHIIVTALLVWRMYDNAKNFKSIENLFDNHILATFLMRVIAFSMIAPNSTVAAFGAGFYAVGITLLYFWMERKVRELTPLFISKFINIVIVPAAVFILIVLARNSVLSGVSMESYSLGYAGLMMIVCMSAIRMYRKAIKSM